MEARVVERVLVGQVVERALVLGAGEDLQELGVEGHGQASSLMSERTSAVRASHSSGVGASRLSRRRGSVFDGRRLNHQDPWSTVSPSRRSRSASAWASATFSMTARGSDTVELTSPESAYRSSGASSSDSGTAAAHSCSSTTMVAT